MQFHFLFFSTRQCVFSSHNLFYFIIITIKGPSGLNSSNNSHFSATWIKHARCNLWLRREQSLEFNQLSTHVIFLLPFDLLLCIWSMLRLVQKLFCFVWFFWSVILLYSVEDVLGDRHRQCCQSAPCSLGPTHLKTESQRDSPSPFFSFLTVRSENGEGELWE